MHTTLTAAIITATATTSQDEIAWCQTLVSGLLSGEISPTPGGIQGLVSTDCWLPGAHRPPQGIDVHALMAIVEECIRKHLVVDIEALRVEACSASEPYNTAMAEWSTAIEDVRQLEPAWRAEMAARQYGSRHQSDAIQRMDDAVRRMNAADVKRLEAEPAMKAAWNRFRLAHVVAAK